MAIKAGFNTTVKLSGISTTLTSSPMTAVSTAVTGDPPNTFQVDGQTLRVWDRDAAFSFKHGSTAIPSSQVNNVDYLFGKVTFSVPKGSSAVVKASGKFLPTTAVAGAHGYNINISSELLDDTDFLSTGYRSRTSGLKDVNVTVNRWDSASTEFFNLINTGGSAVVEIVPSGSSIAARGFFIVESENRSGDVASLEAADITLQLDESTSAAFGYGTL